MEKIKVLSLFSGIGAFEKAISNLGIEADLIGFSEIDKYAVKSYCKIHNISENKNLGDITKIEIKKLPRFIDLITHGSPCQDFSIAGRQAGGDKGLETRSSLMWNTVDIVEWCLPKYVIWENVKNLLSQKHKHNFDNYIEIMNKLGYNSYYQVLNAKNYGIPQNRERVYTVSIRKDIDKNSFKFPEKEELKLRLKDMLENDIEDKYFLNEEQSLKITPTIDTNKNQEPKINVIGLLNIKGNECVRRVYSKDGISPTLTDMQGGNRQPKIIDDPKCIRIGGMYGQTTRWGLYDKAGIAPTLVAAMGEGGGYIPMLEKKGRIRKLTPKECWRLMGFSDEDFEKAQSVPTSNTQLYKQAGNSIVVNVLEKIFKNLFKEEL